MSSIYGLRRCMISIVEIPVLTTTLPCFHYNTVSSVKVSPRNVQVIMICYSENQRSFVAMCCGHVGTIAYAMHARNVSVF